MTMTERFGPKYDGMPDPPTLKERIAALRKDDEVMEFLRTLRVTEYHWIAEREGDRGPVTGGHYDDFGSMKEDCEWLMKTEFRPDHPLGSIRSIRILDALGAVVWSVERPKPVEVLPPIDG